MHSIIYLLIPFIKSCLTHTLPFFFSRPHTCYPQLSAMPAKSWALTAHDTIPFLFHIFVLGCMLAISHVVGMHVDATMIKHLVMIQHANKNINTQRWERNVQTIIKLNNGDNTSSNWLCSCCHPLSLPSLLDHGHMMLLVLFICVLCIVFCSWKISNCCYENLKILHSLLSVSPTTTLPTAANTGSNFFLFSGRRKVKVHLDVSMTSIFACSSRPDEEEDGKDIKLKQTTNHEEEPTDKAIG